MDESFVRKKEIQGYLFIWIRNNPFDPRFIYDGVLLFSFLKG